MATIDWSRSGRKILEADPDVDNWCESANNRETASFNHFVPRLWAGSGDPDAGVLLPLHHLCAGRRPPLRQPCQVPVQYLLSVLRIRMRDPMPFGPWIRNPGWAKNQDPDPGWTSRIIFPGA
jgi:hypothetical protein